MLGGAGAQTVAADDLDSNNAVTARHVRRIGFTAAGGGQGRGQPRSPAAQ